MERRDAFSGYHPLVNILYFALVLAFTMFVMHPVSLTVSLCCALAYHALLRGGRQAGRSLPVLLPVMAMTALLNPAFNHSGATALLYLPTGNPLTLESVLYGLFAAVMLGAAVLWFMCCAAVVATDKLLWIFGRAAPALSLILSMTLRFLPQFRRRLHTLRQARQCMEEGEKQGLRGQVSGAAALLSALMTWSLERAVVTADSMKSRGYGLPGRTAFSLWKLEGRDVLALLWLLACGGVYLYGHMAGALHWQYYPRFQGEGEAGFQLAHLALCLTPIWLHGREVLTWKRLSSKI